MLSMGFSLTGWMLEVKTIALDCFTITAVVVEIAADIMP